MLQNGLQDKIGPHSHSNRRYSEGIFRQSDFIQENRFFFKKKPLSRGRGGMSSVFKPRYAFETGTNKTDFKFQGVGLK